MLIKAFEYMLLLQVGITPGDRDHKSEVRLATHHFQVSATRWDTDNIRYQGSKLGSSRE